MYLPEMIHPVVALVLTSAPFAKHFTLKYNLKSVIEKALESFDVLKRYVSYQKC